MKRILHVGLAGAACACALLMGCAQAPQQEVTNAQNALEAAKAAIDSYGYGISSVRFICGTQDIHKELERRMSVFLGTQDTILYSSCFDANGGVFEGLLGEEDVIISDELNASLGYGTNNSFPFFVAGMIAGIKKLFGFKRQNDNRELSK